MEAAESQVICFRDAQVYASDVKLFMSNAWLNDNCIHFYYEYLTHLFVPETLEALHVKLLDPSVLAYFLFQCQDVEEEEEFRHVYGSYDVLFFPLTDALSFEMSSTHWSLLVWRRKQLVFEYYDSAGKANFQAAEQLLQKWKNVFDIPAALIVKIHTPQQHNEYDCGMYLLLCTQYLVGLLVKDAPIVECALQGYLSLRQKERMLEEIQQIERNVTNDGNETTEGLYVSMRQTRSRRTPTQPKSENEQIEAALKAYITENKIREVRQSIPQTIQLLQEEERGWRTRREAPGRGERLEETTMRE